MGRFLKAFRTVFISIAIISAVELSILATTGSKGDDFRLFGLEYLKEISREKLLLVNKLRYFRDKNSEMVSVGDSSGLVSLKPQVIEKHLNGMKFYNGNVMQPAGIAGYRHIAEIFLQNNSNIKYLIYHISPHQRKIGEEIRIGWSPLIYSNYLSYYHFIFALPSTKYRAGVVNFAYYPNKNSVKLSDSFTKLSEHDGFVNLPFGGKKDVGECDFTGWLDKDGESILGEELTEVKKVAEKYKVKLVVIFGATSCISGEKIKPLLADLEKFQKNNPDVFVPIGLINHRDLSDFGDAFHINASGADSYSEMIGEVLKEMDLSAAVE